MQNLFKKHLLPLSNWMLAVSLLTLSGCEQDGKPPSKNKDETRRHALENERRHDRAQKTPSPQINSGRSSLAQFHAERDKIRMERAQMQEKLQIAKVSFTSDHPPEAVTVEGLSSPETWGSWSVGDKVTLRFSDPLPAQFQLMMTGRAYGPNGGKPITFIFGKYEQPVVFEQVDSTQSLEVKLSEPIDTITMLIPHPTSPKDMNESADNRRLGIGLVQILVLQPNPDSASPTNPQSGQ